MQEGAGDAGAQIVGREPELALLHEFLSAGSGGRAFVLTGGPGIGKSTLWEAGVEVARAQRLRALTARPRDAEAQHSFSGLADLLDGVDTEELAGLPAPQSRALEVALLRAEPTGEPPEPRAISVGFVNALRTLAASEPLLVAIDDVQWLDTASTDAVAFAARRLQAHPVRFLLAKRSRSSSVFERALGPKGLERLEVGPLSEGATRRILSERLPVSLPRRVLRRVVESAGGNPLFALELGRALIERGPEQVGDEEMPVPDLVEELLGKRVLQLPQPLHRLLLAVALSADVRVSELAVIADAGAIDDAVDAGLLVVERDRVRAAHPLLAAAAKRHSRARDRRALHLELAGAVGDDELRALHLALATTDPDAELAATVAAAAATVVARGAAEEAVLLAEHALRLTPPAAAERSDRLLALAEYLLVAGEPQRLTDLLSPEVEALPRASARGRGHLLLAGGLVSNLDDAQDYLERALADSGDDPALRAAVLARKAEYGAVSGVTRIADAEAWALEALPAARLAGPEVERLALYALGWTRILQGRRIDDLSERFRSASDATSDVTGSLERVAGIRLAWRGDVHEARTIFARLLLLADERGEAVSSLLLRLHLCELELRAGEWEAASRVVDEWDPSTNRTLLVPPVYERCRALLAAGRGFPDEVEPWAAQAVAGVEACGVLWDLLDVWRARGLAALLAHEPERAVESLRRVWEHTRRQGVDEPGAFPVAPDLVEALVELGEYEEALEVTARLRELAEQQSHPWGLATAKRCAALVKLASAWDERAGADLADAAAAYEELGLRFDRARSLLSLGRAQRRLKKWGAARSSLEQAAAAFDELGSPGWAEQARSELARVGARRPQPAGELTKTERRVAELAAEGRSNKEIARTLFVTVHTVEVHLSKAYAKLGIRSRAQLAGRLSA